MFVAPRQAGSSGSVRWLATYRAAALRWIARAAVCHLIVFGMIAAVSVDAFNRRVGDGPDQRVNRQWTTEGISFQALRRRAANACGGEARLVWLQLSERYAERQRVEPRLVLQRSSRSSGLGAENASLRQPGPASGLMQLMPRQRHLGFEMFNLMSVEAVRYFRSALLDQYGREPFVNMAAYNAEPAAWVKCSGIPV